MPLPQILFLVGPTAVGKSEIACHLAKTYNGEIISCDAAQVYQEIRIASNKPPQDVLDQVPHHLIDAVSIREEFNVSRFNQLAAEALKKILDKNKRPIVAGGSGLYMQVLLDGIFEEGPKDQRLRQKLQQEAQENGNQFLHEKLKKIDPQAAARIHVNDQRRLIRALEVYSLESKPISQKHRERQGWWGKYDIKIIALTRGRADL